MGKTEHIYRIDESAINISEGKSTLGIAYKNIKDNEKVLEIGCATGYWGKYVKKNKNIELIGLDYSAEQLCEAEETKAYDKLIHYDLNNLDDTLEKYFKYFDKIVILDVLEHLYNPAQVIVWCSNLLKDNGQFIISIPNVSHKSIIHQLINNRFDYTEFGLLDKTHIRFFTIDTFSELINKCNLKIQNIQRIKNKGSKYSKKVPWLIKKYIDFNNPESSVWQYVIFISKTDKKK